MAISAMALLQQHDARRNIVIEPAARRRAAIEARVHSELRAQSGRKNLPACFVLLLVRMYFWSDCKPEGPLFSARFVYVCVCL